MPMTTATSTAGIRGMTFWSTFMTTRATAPMASAHRLVAPARIFSTVATISPMSPSAEIENPQSLRICPTRMVSAKPFM